MVLQKKSLIFLILLNNSLVFGQDVRLSSIALEEVCVNNVKLGESKTLSLNELGSPDSTSTGINEFERTFYENYHYGNSIVIFENEIFVGFDLSDQKLDFDKGRIEVGSKIDVLRKNFKISYESRYSNESNEIIKIQIGDSDSYLLFVTKNNIVVRIMTWDDQ